jgi:hypothetical protein
MEMTLDHTLALEAKAMVALAFRNGPIEALHAGNRARFAVAIRRYLTSPTRR